MNAPRVDRLLRIRRELMRSGHLDLAADLGRKIYWLRETGVITQEEIEAARYVI